MSIYNNESEILNNFWEVNQLLLAESKRWRLGYQVKKLRKMEHDIIDWWIQSKQLERNTYYIWRTQEDEKVRPFHATNNGKIFSSDNPPATGNPGEDFNCRCWAEPVNTLEYANQKLISPVNDHKRWTNEDFVYHYRHGNGETVSLRQAGILGDVINHFGYTLNTYDRVNKQIMEAAKRVGEGPVPYNFNNTYDFGGWLSTFFPFFFDGVIFSLGDSTVKGTFEGEVRKERGYLVINGIMSYEFIDAFTDPTSEVDTLMEEENISRQEAIDRLGNAVDKYGIPYGIEDSWQTKLNATVRIDDNNIQQ